MLSDLDVEGNDANYFARQIHSGKVFVSVDTRLAPGQRDAILRILGPDTVKRAGDQAADTTPGMTRFG